jgi:hypothetical protein
MLQLWNPLCGGLCTADGCRLKMQKQVPFAAFFRPLMTKTDFSPFFC